MVVVGRDVMVAMVVRWGEILDGYGMSCCSGSLLIIMMIVFCRGTA